MDSLSEWLPPLCVGFIFEPFGVFKLYGLYKGYEGSPTKSFWE